MITSKCTLFIEDFNSQSDDYRDLNLKRAQKSHPHRQIVSFRTWLYGQKRTL